jgi:hypothetical protein
VESQQGPYVECQHWLCVESQQGLCAKRPLESRAVERLSLMSVEQFGEVRCNEKGVVCERAALRRLQQKQSLMVAAPDGNISCSRGGSTSPARVVVSCGGSLE